MSLLFFVALIGFMKLEKFFTKTLEDRTSTDFTDLQDSVCQGVSHLLVIISTSKTLIFLLDYRYVFGYQLLFNYFQIRKTLQQIDLEDDYNSCSVDKFV